MANKKPRVPMQVAPKFENRIKKLQTEIMKKKGQNISLRDLTETISDLVSFDEMEKAIMDVGNIDIKINFDGRKRR